MTSQISTRLRRWRQQVSNPVSSIIHGPDRLWCIKLCVPGGINSNFAAVSLALSQVSVRANRSAPDEKIQSSKSADLDFTYRTFIEHSVSGLTVQSLTVADDKGQSVMELFSMLLRETSK